jgi:hypothetical protein
VALALASGLGTQLLGPSPSVDLLGSVLYVVLVGLLVQLVWPNLHILPVTAVALAVATAVELLQLTPIPAAIVAAVPAARLVLGSAFDPVDLVAYWGGAAVLFLLLSVITRAGPAARRGP